MVSTIRKGKQRSRPLYLKRIRDKFEYEITFNESCIYAHGDNDQWDWNKLIGVKKHYFSPQKDSFMIGWRWNDKKERLELTWYMHDSAGKATFNERGVFYINKQELKDPISISMVIDSDGVDLIMKSINFTYWTVLDASVGRKGWLIRDWFGGQKCAPHSMTKEYRKIV
jgi:hypothetical protein